MNSSGSPAIWSVMALSSSVPLKRDVPNSVRTDGSAGPSNPALDGSVWGPVLSRVCDRDQVWAVTALRWGPQNANPMLRLSQLWMALQALDAYCRKDLRFR